LTQLAYTFTIDCFERSSVIDFDPDQIAIAAIFLSSSILEEEVKSTHKQLSWNEPFGCEKKSIDQILESLFLLDIPLIIPDEIASDDVVILGE
jgi:hypothetical protein